MNCQVRFILFPQFQVTNKGYSYYMVARQFTNWINRGCRINKNVTTKPKNWTTRHKSINEIPFRCQSNRHIKEALKSKVSNPNGMSIMTHALAYTIRETHFVHIYLLVEMNFVWWTIYKVNTTQSAQPLHMRHTHWDISINIRFE